MFPQPVFKLILTVAAGTLSYCSDDKAAVVVISINPPIPSVILTSAATNKL